MKQKLGMKIKQTQKQSLSARQIQYLDFMTLGQRDLDTAIMEAFQSNPTLEIEDGFEKEPGLVFEEVLNSYIAPPSLKEDLYLQLLEKDKLDHQIMSYLIESIDEEGFIPAADSEIAIELSYDEASVNLHRKALQDFDPLGVGSRSMKDSLIFQLHRYEDKTSKLAVKVVEEFLTKNYFDEAAIMEKLNISSETLDDVLERIHCCRLNFKQDMDQTRSDLPDLIVSIDEGELSYESFRDYTKLKINDTYRNVRDKDIAIWYQESERLLEQIHYRNTTLYRVFEVIVQRQQDFFFHQAPLRPLTLADIAAQLGLSISTVSRAVSHKVCVFNRELYYLADFFVSSTKAGDSADEIKRRLRSIIVKEEKPYSDQALADLLNKEGIRVERRTITKYRQELNIPSSTERKRCKKWD